MTTTRDADTLLRELFGYASFRGDQAQIIAACERGDDTLVLMPTGGGKSLCYQIPALLRPGTGLVVSPLIALMQDQVRALTLAGVRAACLNSALNVAEERAVVAALAAGELDLLYLAPERLLLPATLELIGRCRIALVAIDEAHCVSQWGHDFRADYLGLDVLAERLPGVPRMALTATATPVTRREIVERLALHKPREFIGSFDRPNIRYTVSDRRDGRSQLARFLRERRGQAGIVYCQTRKKVETTAAWLADTGVTALPYHAGLDSAARELHQQRFQNEDGVVIVATIAFGMGIDKPDVRFVAHLDLPRSVEAYYQETGRAGRDGAPAEAFMLYGLADVVRQTQFIDGSDADERFKRHERSRLDALLGWCETSDCRRRPLLEYFGEATAGPCGNCDNCLNPPETWDATEPARKLLSAVYRTGQRFGAAHVIDVLRGVATDKIARFGHADLSVFGIGADLDNHDWRSVIRQLLALGLLHADASRYGALRLTERSRPVLRGERELPMRRDRARPKGAAARQAAPDPDVAPADEPLWQTLKALRLTIARDEGVPPYVIFHDRTLKHLVRQRPGTDDEMLDIPGIGAAKLERYGERFLAAIAAAGEPEAREAV